MNVLFSLFFLLYINIQCNCCIFRNCLFICNKSIVADFTEKNVDIMFSKIYIKIIIFLYCTLFLLNNHKNYFCGILASRTIPYIFGINIRRSVLQKKINFIFLIFRNIFSKNNFWGYYSTEISFMSRQNM